jgi:hypothetical protein
MLVQLAAAARLGPVGASPPLALLFGRAMMPDGLETLQNPPVSLNSLAAARVRHALSRAPDVSDAEILAAATDYANEPECVLPAALDRLVNMCRRAGSECPRGAALGLVWARQFDSALAFVTHRPPYPFLREAMRAEVKRMRREAF